MKKFNGTVLDNIKYPADLKNLEKGDLETLCAEIRALMIEHVSNNGGHLASNLGIVELTVALLRSFDFTADKIIWDVGHQCYPYKILTDRKDRFPDIRKRGGISGFPKREESPYDFFNTGHSSTAISAAMGFARAARLSGAGGYSIAVVGDGALTGGMAFEALNNAGASKDRIIVILNDNEMSISKNVGGFAEYFSRMRTFKFYSKANTKLREKIEKIPVIGKFTTRKVHQLKSAVKYLFSQMMLFEEMGFHYMGPVDGHDIKKIESMMENAKSLDGPVLIHAVTVKGKGYERAEKDPENYHGVPVFNADDGICADDRISFSEAFGLSMEKIVKKDPSVAVVCPAVGPGCGLKHFSETYPDRYHDVGIAEQHAVTMAAGMACGNLKPVVAGYSSFMQRAYDQILHDVCLMNLHVVMSLDRAGLTGSDGETHQGIYDLSYLGHLPNMQIFAPANFTQLGEALEYAIGELEGPVTIRYPKGDRAISENIALDISKPLQTVREGSDCVIFSHGRMLEHSMKAAELLKRKCIDCAVVNVFRLKPLDFEGIASIASGFKFAFCVEDVVNEGSASQKISSYIQQKGLKIRFDHMTLPESFNQSGKVDEILESISMDADGIVGRIENQLKHN